MRPQFWISACLGALGLLSLTPRAQAAPGIPCRFYGINAGAPVWNGTTVFDQAFAQQMASDGAHAVRLDFLIESKTDWDAEALDRYDKIVNAALAAGLEPLGLMNYGAVQGGQVAWNDDTDLDGFNDYVDRFANASKILIEHFAGRIQRWEIWNEPSCWSDPNWATDPQHAGCSYMLPRVFAKMLAEVYVRNETVLKTKNISLVSGGLFAHDIGGSFTTATDYMTEVYQQDVWEWLETNKQRRYPWDFLGYHIYVEQGQQTEGSKLDAYADALRSLATSKGDKAPFLVTEVGWTTAGVSEEVQAANLTTTFNTLSKRSDVAQVFWFSFRDAPDLLFGIRTMGGGEKKAAAALAAVAAGCVAGSDAGADAPVVDSSPSQEASPQDSPTAETATQSDVGPTSDSTSADSPSKTESGIADTGQTGDSGTSPGTNFRNDEDDGGCSCQVGRTAPSSTWAWLLLLLARRRRPCPQCRSTK